MCRSTNIFQSWYLSLLPKLSRPGPIWRRKTPHKNWNHQPTMEDNETRTWFPNSWSLPLQSWKFPAAYCCKSWPLLPCPHPRSARRFSPCARARPWSRRSARHHSRPWTLTLHPALHPHLEKVTQEWQISSHCFIFLHRTRFEWVSERGTFFIKFDSTSIAIPPLTGASTNTAPLFSASTATSFDVAGSIVLLSINNVPVRTVLEK